MLNVILETIKHSLKKADGWVNENLHIDKDKAQMPGRILQDALEQVGYKYSATQFTLARTWKGWVSVPFAPDLLAITFNRVSNAIDMHRGIVAPELMENDGRILKDIIHTFCYEGTVLGIPEFSAVDWLTEEVKILPTVWEQQVGIRDKEEIHKVAGLMLQAGLMNRKSRKNGDRLYLTKQADSLLT